MPTLADIKWMDAAARYASRFLGTTAENPTVAALIVDPKTDILVSRAVTAPGGRPHAEPQAIESAGEKSADATLYVTLEPCHHHGKTPPCVDAVIDAGIKRVVIGQLDADPRTAGQSVEKLRAAKIDVIVLVDHQPTAILHRAFFKRVRKGLPFITAKLAVSKDGMVGRIGEGNVAITGPEAKAWTHTLRSRVDGIAVGAKTAILDNPSLNVRLRGLESRSPRPIVISSATSDLPSGVTLGVDPRFLSVCGNKDMKSALQSIANEGINHLLVEGGPKLLNELLDAGLIDEFYLLESNIEIGAGGLPAVQGSNIGDKLASLGFLDYGTSKLGADRVTHFQRND
jgi:diaminohydroxyphosphoribosylaminopyrimidine deaminase/5-amino-6-(5-phosphoribosylamino)uracil reductase